MPAAGQYLIAIPVYDGVDLLDVSAPYELFSTTPAPPFFSGDPSVAKPPVYTPGAGSTCNCTLAESIANVLKRTGPS